MYMRIVFAFLSLSLVHAAPQGIGAVICDSTPVFDWHYVDSQPPQDVTSTFGDNGWENYDANVCTSNSESEHIAVDRSLPYTY